MTLVATVDNIFVRCGNVSLFACTEPQQTILELKKSLCSILGHDAENAVLLRQPPKVAPGKRERDESVEVTEDASKDALDGDVTLIEWMVLADDSTVGDYKMHNATEETLLFPLLWLRLREGDELTNYAPLPAVPQEVIEALKAYAKG